MDLLQLEYFLAVARSGNMTAAAAALNVAQSSVSRCIARLETDLGVPLFERSGRGICLNDYGRVLYERAETIMREVADGKRELKEMRDQHIGRISLATSSARQINPLMIQYLEENPEVLLRQRRITDLNDIKTKLDSGVLDYALTYMPLPDPEYQWTPLICESYCALMRSDHPLSGESSIPLSALANERFLVNDSDNPDFVEECCQRCGVSPVFGFIGNEYEVLGAMVERGVGVSLIATLAMYDMKRALPMEHFGRIRLVPIRDECFQRTLGILFRKHHYFSAAAKGFYKKLISYFKAIDAEMNHPL